MKKDALILVRGGGDLGYRHHSPAVERRPACAGAGSGASDGDPAAGFSVRSRL